MFDNFFSSQYFLTEKKTFSVFLLSYKNTHGSLGELDKAMETLPNLPVSFPQHFSFSQTFTHISLTQQNTVHVHSVLNRMQNVLDITWEKNMLT